MAGAVLNAGDRLWPGVVLRCAIPWVQKRCTDGRRKLLPVCVAEGGGGAPCWTVEQAGGSHTVWPSRNALSATPWLRRFASVSCARLTPCVLAIDHASSPAATQCETLVAARPLCALGPRPTRARTIIF